jgi:hypothetical protein
MRTGFDMENEVIRQNLRDVRRQIRTPRSAAWAGIIFGVLFGASVLLIEIALPESMARSSAEDIVRNQDLIRLALNLIPYAGVAFLWFIGVARALLGEYEDQLFATIFLGSGLLLLALIFVAAALAAGILNAEATIANLSQPSEALQYARMVMEQITGNYAVRMAGIFMLSLGNIWFQTGVMPRWLALITLVLALVNIFLISTTFVVLLSLPAWVLLISVYILVRNRDLGTATTKPA